MKRRSKKLLIVILCSLVAVILTASFVITFARDEKIPTWNEIFVGLGIKSIPVTENSEDFVAFLDVGQGDSAIIVSNGQTALIDAGEDENEDVLYQKLRAYGVDSFDFVLGTHIHSDHIGGLPYLLERFSFQNIMIDSSDLKQGDSTSLNKILSISKNKKVNIYSPMRAAVVNIGDFELTVIGFYPDATGLNNRSVITMAKIGEKKFLFTGDAETQAENFLLNDNINVDCDVLKVGHHGSKTSSSNKFLEAATPEYAVISCGLNNQYSHPNDEIVLRLEQLNAKIFRTDKDGDVVFTVEEETLVAKSEK